MKQNVFTKNYLTILLHIGSWSLVFLWPLLELQDSMFANLIFVRNLVTMFFVALIFYINYFFLVESLFLRNKKKLFFIINFVLVLVFVFLMDYALESIRGDFNNVVGKGRNGIPNRKYFMFVQFIITLVLSVGMSIGIKITNQWNKRELDIEKTKRMQLLSANKYLRYQIQPHFLFNTLNSIYSLTSKKSNDAPEVVITLSDMMRYMLYNTDGEYVLLQDELKYIENYIKLQRLRIANNENIKINIHGSIQTQKISPFLFISFIENAFKYGTDFKGNTKIKINIHVNENELKFSCINLIGNRKVNEENSGIGLTNTKERLQLLYPERHILNIEEANNMFVVDLTLKLD